MGKLISAFKIFVLSSKRSIVTAGLLILLASFCLNMLLVLTVDYTSRFDSVKEELNGEDNVFVISAPDTDALKSKIREQLESKDYIKEYEITDTKWFWGGCSYGKGTMLSTILPIKKSIAVNKTVGKCQITNDDPSIKGVYLPYSFFVTGNYHVGDDFTVTDNLKSETVKVAGFYYSTANNTQNCYAIYFVFDDEVYENISKTFTAPAVLVSVKLNDISYSNTLEKALPSSIESTVPGASLVVQSNAQSVKNARYVTTLIASASIGVAAIVFLIVALVGLNVYISNYIRDKKKNIGILQTMGYTNQNITKPIIALFSTLSVVCSAIGAGLFYVLFPYLNRLFEGQVGLPYPVHFVPTLSVGAAAFVLLDAYVVVRLTLNKIKKITPVNAINPTRIERRKNKHSFSLKKSKLSLNLSLAISGMIARRRQTAVIIITMFVVAYNLVFMIMQLNTSTMSSKELAGVLLGESCDVSAVTLSSDRENFEKELAENKQIQSFVSYDVLNCDHVGGQRLQALIIGDGEKLNNKATYYEGSYPKNENQVAVGGKYAKEHHIKIGDTIELSLDGKSVQYTVCGLNQSVRYLGADCSFTRTGFERIKKTDTNQYYINLVQNADREKFIDELRDDTYTLNVSDIRAYQTGTVEPYANIIFTIAILLVFMSLFVMLFVIINMTSYILKTKEETYGIFMAMGLTSRDLLIQTVSEISIPVIFATAVGIVISYFTVGPMTGLFVYRVGMMKSCFTVPLSWVLPASIGLVVAVLILVYVLSLRIKKLSPKKLLGGM